METSLLHSRCSVVWKYDAYDGARPRYTQWWNETSILWHPKSSVAIQCSLERGGALVTRVAMKDQCHCMEGTGNRVVAARGHLVHDPDAEASPPTGRSDPDAKC